MICMSCKAEIKGTPKFCPKCGVTVEATPQQSNGTKKCPQCGAENALAAKFCKADGYRFSGEAEKSVMTVSPAMPAPAAQTFGETQAKAAPAVPAPVLSTDDSVVCPQCGTSNLSGAKFCKKDGYPLQGGVAVQQANPVAKEHPVAAQPTKALEVQPPAPLARDIDKVQATAAVPAAPSQPLDDSVICPKCGTPNLAGAKFCKKDGQPLQAGVATPQPMPAAKEPAIAAQEAKGSGVQSSVPSPVPQATPIKQPAPAPVRSADIGRKASAEKILPVAAAGKPRKGVLVGALVGIALLASAGGGYAYWAGYFGNRQGDIQAKINTELGGRGLSNVKVTIDRDWNASLSGTVLQQADKDQALELIRSHKELKKIAADQVQVQPSAADLEKSLNKALANGGFSNITAQVDKELVATLAGVAARPDQKAEALNVAKGVTGLKNIRDDIQVAIAETAPPALPPDVAPPAAPPLPAAEAAAPAPPPPPPIDRAVLERDLNTRLRTNRLGGVTGHVNPDMTIALSGTVRSAEDRDRALSLAGSLPGSNSVRENIQVAAPRIAKPAPLQVPQQPQQAAAIDLGKLEGDINRALRNGGANGVTAQVGDDLSVTLKGSASSAAEKEHAMQVARQFKGVHAVKDKIFVVE